MSHCDRFSERFGGVQRVYGRAGLELIRDLHLCVVGLGGVGSWAVEALARSGVGRLTLIDHDRIESHNINRQIQALDSTAGRSKVEVMAERIGQINPECRVEAIDDFLTLQTLEDYLAPPYDYLIDAIDSISFKSAMIAQNVPPLGVDILTPDLPAIARACGWQTVEADTAAGMREAVEGAARSGACTMIRYTDRLREGLGR